MKAQTGIPYLPMREDFGGSQVANPDNFVPTTGDYTLEVQATAGTEIGIAFAGLSYTPSSSGPVRFVQKDGKVYVFEDGVFKIILTPDPEYTTTGGNILRNPGFEEIETEVLAAGRWKPTVWDTWNGGMPTWGGETGYTNVREDANYRSEGTKSIIMHSNARQLLQELPENSLEANAHYLLSYDYWTSAGTGNGGATYQIYLKKEKHTLDIQSFQGHTTLESETAKSSFSAIFETEAEIPATVWFVIQRDEEKVDWLDNFKLLKVNAANKGITGAGSAVYHAGVAFAPENLSFENGDYIDMTGRLVNPGFDHNTAGWIIEASGSKISTAEKAGGLIPGNQNHLQFWVGSGGIKGKMYQTIHDLPNGKYTLKAAIAPSFSGTVSLYANSGNTTVVSGTSKYYETTAIVYDGSLETGLDIHTSGSPTLDIDDFTLYFSGIDADGYLQVLTSKIAEAKADTTAMHGNLGLPGYHNLSQYREALEKVTNLPDQEAATLVEAIQTISAAIDEYDAILAAYAPLMAAIEDLITQLYASGYPVRDSFSDAADVAKAIYESESDHRADIAGTVAMLSGKTAILTAYQDLKEALANALTTLAANEYPGKIAFQEAIDAAQAILADPEEKNLEASVSTLAKAQKDYYNSQYAIQPVEQVVSWVDTSLKGSEKFVLRVAGKPFYMTNIQVRLDKLYGYHGWTDAAMEAVVKRAADDGFNTISVPVHWREVEPSKDEFDWTILDKFMGWCKKYGIKMEMLWFSWSSGGRVQYLMNYGGVQTPRTPDYVCSLSGKSEFNMLRTEWEYSLDWRDTKLRDREKYVLGQVMEHIAVWDANNESPHTVIGVQLGNEARGHGNNSATASEIIDYYHHVGAGVKESKYVVWTRLNCVSYETPGRINANEAKRNSTTGTNIDFVGIDIYGTSASSIKGTMNNQLPHTGKNYTMIMEIDAKDANSPVYQMAALAGNKAFDYYNMGFVDGNDLYTNSGMTLVERSHISLVRQRNKILNLANQEVALKAQGGSLYVYNYAGNSTTTETGLEGIAFTPGSTTSQAVAIRRSPSEIVFLITNNGYFTLPATLEVVSASKGYFNENDEWVNEGEVTVRGTSLVMPVTSAVLLKLKAEEEEVTGVIKNPSFEEGTYHDGTYTVPKEWTLSGTINGADVQLKSGDAAHGTYRYYIWATSGSTIDFYQDVVLPAGQYTVKAALKPNADHAASLYATVNGETAQSAALSASWSSWVTTPVSFTVLSENATVRIGVISSSAVMMDHFRLFRKNDIPDGILSVETEHPALVDIAPCEGGILISASHGAHSLLPIYLASGQVVKTVHMTKEQVFVPLETGIYLINNQKVAVK